LLLSDSGSERRASEAGGDGLCVKKAFRKERFFLRKDSLLRDYFVAGAAGVCSAAVAWIFFTLKNYSDSCMKKLDNRRTAFDPLS
jgi:hypothetical protein